MYFNKQEIAEKVSKIFQQRHTYDQKIQQLKARVEQCKQSKVVDFRKYFITTIEQLQQIVRNNTNALDLLSHRCERLSKQGTQLSSQKIRIEALKDYFKDFKHQVREQRQKGQAEISNLQRWDLIKDGSGARQQQQQSLINSHAIAKETTQVARMVLGSLLYQGGMLQSARQKMSMVVKSINFSGNLTQLMKRRTKQDNKLISLLSVGLFLWISICLFVIKPWYRDT